MNRSYVSSSNSAQTNCLATQRPCKSGTCASNKLLRLLCLCHVLGQWRYHRTVEMLHTNSIYSGSTGQCFQKWFLRRLSYFIPCIPFMPFPFCFRVCPVHKRSQKLVSRKLVFKQKCNCCLILSTWLRSPVWSTGCADHLLNLPQTCLITKPCSLCDSNQSAPAAARVRTQCLREDSLWNYSSYFECNSAGCDWPCLESISNHCWFPHAHFLEKTSQNNEANLDWVSYLRQ